MSRPPAVELRRVSKSFGATRALAGADLVMRGGEVHALVGHNGSGKSTLVKLLAAVEPADSGSEALVDGAPVELGPRLADRLAFVHQDLGLIDSLTVADNLALVGNGSRWWTAPRGSERRAAVVLARAGADVDPSRPVASLSQAQRSMVAIARALASTTDAHPIFVLDEPTASLTRGEAHQVLDLMRAIRDRGGAVLFVSHRIEEVFAVADTVTVLRNGRVVASTPVASCDEQALLTMMLGAPPGALYPRRRPPAAGVALAVRDLVGRGVEHLSFDVAPGEIVGVTGTVGSGHDALPYLLNGGTRRSAGAVVVDGHELPRDHDPAEALAAGLAVVPGDRQRQAIIHGASVADNVVLPSLRPRRFLRWMSAGDAVEQSQPWLERAGMTPPRPAAAIGQLSGGNQQKVIVARWLRCRPRVLVLDEPTHAVDVGAKAAIHASLVEAAAAGVGIILCSNESEDLAELCDRVLVLADGHVTAELAGGRLTGHEIATRTLAGMPG